MGKATKMHGYKMRTPCGTILVVALVVSAILYFKSFGHVYSLTFTIPSSGVVTKDDIILEGTWKLSRV